MKKLAICAAVLILAVSFAGGALAGCSPQLSQEEMDQIKAARLAFEEKMRPLEKQLAQARSELRALLDDPETDFDTLQGAQAEIDKLQDDRDQRWEQFEAELFKRFPALTERRTCRVPPPDRDDGQRGE